VGKVTSGVRAHIHKGASELFSFNPVCKTCRFCCFGFPRTNADSFLCFWSSKLVLVSRMLRGKKLCLESPGWRFCGLKVKILPDLVNLVILLLETALGFKS